MATKGAIAAGKEQAISRLAASMAVLSERLGVVPADILKRHRDPAYAQLLQLEALADWSERLVQALDKTAEESGEEQSPADGEQPEVEPTGEEESSIIVEDSLDDPPTDEPPVDMGSEEPSKSKRKGR